MGKSAALIARALDWPEARASILGVAARLHDVGKIGIPDAVLLKPAKLTASEYAHMQTHTLIGARILSGGRSDLLQLAEEIARTHHERWDGAGYPLGLRGEDIPLAGRIVAVADVFDALTQARPYKDAWTPEQALAEIAAQAGSHFDPAVVAVATKVLRHGADDPAVDAALGDVPALEREDLSNMLSVFEHLLAERSRELEAARREAERAAERLERMALTDSLTGLGNRWFLRPGPGRAAAPRSGAGIHDHVAGCRRSEGGERHAGPRPGRPPAAVGGAGLHARAAVAGHRLTHRWGRVCHHLSARRVAGGGAGGARACHGVPPCPGLRARRRQPRAGLVSTRRGHHRRPAAAERPAHVRAEGLHAQCPRGAPAPG